MSTVLNVDAATFTLQTRNG